MEVVRDAGGAAELLLSKRVRVQQPTLPAPEAAAAPPAPAPAAAVVAHQQQQQQPTTAATALLGQLPDALLTEIVAGGGSAGPTQRQLHGVLALVCSQWREAILARTQQLSVGLTSDAGATALWLWLSRHGGRLEQLSVGTVGLFARHVSHGTRLAVFHALHTAAGSPPAQEQPAGAAAAEGASGGVRAGAGGSDGTAPPPPSPPLPAAAAAAAAMPVPELRELAQLPLVPVQHHQHQQPLQLTRLTVNMRLSPADCAAIAALPAARLARLELTGSRTRRLALDGVRALACLAQLKCLKLQQLGVGDDATVVLAQHLTALSELSVSGNNIGPAGAAAIGQHCRQLQVLDISVNRIKGVGLVSLCEGLPRLESLSLAGNPGACDATSLQQLQRLTRLRSLSVATTDMCNQGLAALCAACPQLAELQAGHNPRVSKVDALSSLVALTSLSLARNPLQISAAKALAALPLRALVLFDAMPSPKAIKQLSQPPPGGALAAHLTSLALGVDPSLNPDVTPALQLAQARTCSALFGALELSGQPRLAALSIPCTGLADAQAVRLLPKLTSLTALNLSYNPLAASGLHCLRALPLLQRLEVRAMRPELTDDACAELAACTRLQLLDLAHNDVTSEGVRQLGSLRALQHLELRNNAQVEKWGLLSAAAGGLTAITHLNLLEISDVAARAFRPATRPRSGGAAASDDQASAAAAAAAAAVVAAARLMPAAAGSRPHADLWSVFPCLQELVVEAAHARNVGRGGGRLMFNSLGD